MFAITTFIVALALLAVLVMIKSLENKHNQTFMTSDWLAKFDPKLVRLFVVINIWFKHVNLNNAKLLFARIIASIRKLILAWKKKFDHKHSPFFVKRDHPKNKGSVSFFLKNVSDYKKTLRNK